MSIEYTTGDIFASDCEALVNPVNCVGVMGAGLAKQFKQRYPEMFSDYAAWCATGGMAPGSISLWSTEETPYVFLVATKDHWRDPSTLDYVKRCMDGLVLCAPDLVESIAVPALGCGLGGLAWADVKPIIEAAAARAPQIRWVVYEPG